MAKRIKKAPKKRKKQPEVKAQLLRIATALCILTGIVGFSAALVHHFFAKKPTALPSKPRHEVTAPAEEKRAQGIPTYEIYPQEEPLPIRPPDKTAPPEGPELPKVAIIIDDIGHDRKIAKKFCRLDPAITLSILPFSPFQKDIVRLARLEGNEIMLHLPMEPDEYPRISPGPGALLTAMSPDQLIEQLNKNLDAMKLCKGVNNHMGSKMTSVSTRMYQIFTILKKRNLYFIDSRTTRLTLCKPSARLLQLPFAERDVFIDHTQSPEFIHNQIKQLLRIAQKQGHAVAIAHPHDMTYQIFEELLAEMKKKVRLVPASSIVRIID